MNRRTVAVALIVVAIGLLGYWIAAGAEYYTLTQVQEKFVDPDDPFASETIVWKDEFRPGLITLIGPIVGVLLLIAATLFWTDARRRRQIAQPTTPVKPAA